MKYDFPLPPEVHSPSLSEALPARSRLFCLEPIGLGTSRTEGLISYIIRLAGAHSVNPRRLIRTEFVAVQPAIDQILTAVFFRQNARTINGHYAYANAFCAAATDLTGASDLRYLTLLPLENLLPHNGEGLIARRLQWCPACLAEMATSGQDVYRPLAWSFLHYQICSIHHLAMSERCPECGSFQHVLPKYPSVAHCSQCGAWLGCKGPPVDSELSEKQWISVAIEDIVANLAQLEIGGTIENLMQTIQYAARKYTEGKRKRLCLEIGLKLWAPGIWMHGGHPSFPQWLAIAYGLDIMPSQLFLQPKQYQDIVAGRPRRFPTVLQLSRSRTVLSELDRQQLACRLQKIVAATEDCRSLSAIARQFQFDLADLRHCAPENCARIQAKYLRMVKLRSAQRHARNLEKLKSIVGAFIQNGEFPGAGKVNKMLRQQGLALAQPELKHAYLELITNCQDRVTIAQRGD